MDEASKYSQTYKCCKFCMCVCVSLSGAEDKKHLVISGLINIPVSFH